MSILSILVITSFGGIRDFLARGLRFRVLGAIIAASSAGQSDVSPLRRLGRRYPVRFA